MERGVSKKCITWHVALAAMLTVTLNAVAVGESAPQGSVTGYVRDAEGSPLSGATVWLIGTDRTATTGLDGRFFLGDIEPGDYKFLVDAKDFAPRVDRIGVASGQAVLPDFSLDGIVAGANPIVAVVGAEREDDRVYVDLKNGEEIDCGTTPAKCVSEPGKRRFRVEDSDKNVNLCEWDVTLRQGDERCFVCVESSGKAERCPPREGN